VNIRDVIAEVLENAAASWTAHERHLVELVAQDYFSLLSRKLQGDDVDEELRIVVATVKSLQSATQATAVSALDEALGKILDWIAGQFKLSSLIAV
jgi:hypothetical protein